MLFQELSDLFSRCPHRLRGLFSGFRGRFAFPPQALMPSRRILFLDSSLLLTFRRGFRRTVQRIGGGITSFRGFDGGIVVLVLKSQTFRHPCAPESKAREEDTYPLKL